MARSNSCTTRSLAKLLQRSRQLCRPEWPLHIAGRNFGAGELLFQRESAAARAWSRSSYRCHHAQTFRLLFNELPDRVLELKETWIALEAQITRSVERNLEHVFHAAGPSAHHDYAIREVN